MICLILTLNATSTTAQEKIPDTLKPQDNFYCTDRKGAERIGECFMFKEKVEGGALQTTNHSMTVVIGTLALIFGISLGHSFK